MGFIPFLGRGSIVGPKICFVPNLLSRAFIMQGVKKKIIKLIQVLLYIYIYMRNSAMIGFGLKWGDD